MDFVLFDFDAFISGSKDVDYQEAIKKMSLSLMKFLIENDLLVDINPFNQDGSVKKDLIFKLQYEIEQYPNLQFY